MINQEKAVVSGIGGLLLVKERITMPLSKSYHRASWQKLCCANIFSHTFFSVSRRLCVPRKVQVDTKTLAEHFGCAMERRIYNFPLARNPKPSFSLVRKKRNERGKKESYVRLGKRRFSKSFSRNKTSWHVKLDGTREHTILYALVHYI